MHILHTTYLNIHFPILDGGNKGEFHIMVYGSAHIQIIVEIVHVSLVRSN